MNIISTVKLKDEMIDRLPESNTYRFNKMKDFSNEEKARAEVLITYGSDITIEEAAKFPNVKWLHVMSAGVDEIPKTLFDQAIVTNSSGIHKIPMTEFAMGLILQYYKQLPSLKKAEKNNEWIKYSKSEELYGKEAHILGTGNIGSHLAKALQVFGVSTHGYNTNGRDIDGFDKTHKIDDLNETVVTADILVNVLPSTEKTIGLLKVDTFKAMKDDGIFVNIGRGTVMSDETLIEILEEQYIAHVLSDVFNEEPLPENSPLYGFDNLTITPHCSAKTDMYLYRAFDIFLDNLDRFNKDETLVNVVEFEKGY